MKWIATGVTALVVGLTLAGCGGSADASPRPETVTVDIATARSADATIPARSST